MTFRELLSRAKDEDRQAIETLLGLYKPLLLKESIHHPVHDRRKVFGVSHTDNK